MAENETQAPGAELKRAREARGMSVHQLAVELHVSDAMISAMERGDYAVLGEPVFVRGHLRNYARALGLPESDVLAGYDSTQHRPAPPVLQPIPHTGTLSPRAREWSMRAVSGAVALVLLVLLVSWWLRRPETPVPQPESMVPAAATAPAPAASTRPMTALTDLADSATTTAKTPAKTAANVAAAGKVPAPATRAAKPAAQAVAMHPAATGPITPPGDMTHVKFTLGAASWVEVYDNNGKRIYYDLAAAGSNLELSGAGPLQVFLGNAPGVGVELDGAPFDIKPFLRTDNTARFKLGAAAKPSN